MQLFQQVAQWMEQEFRECQLEPCGDGGFIDVFSAAIALRVTVGRNYFDVEVVDVQNSKLGSWTHIETLNFTDDHGALIKKVWSNQGLDDS